MLIVVGTGRLSSADTEPELIVESSTTAVQATMVLRDDTFRTVTTLINKVWTHSPSRRRELIALKGIKVINIIHTLNGDLI